MAMTVGGLNAKVMGLSNPASQNCVAKGGDLQIAKRGDEGEYGICLFTDSPVRRMGYVSR